MFILKNGAAAPAPSLAEEPQPTEMVAAAVETALAEDRISSQIEAPQKAPRRKALSDLRDIFFDLGPLIAGIFAGVAIGALYLSGQ